MTNIPKLSEDLLLKVKSARPYASIVQAIQNISFKQLEDELHNDTLKKTFWINCYNAFFQLLRKDKDLTKPDIYRKSVINIAGILFSLDDIEHGILRKYRYKYSLGFLPNIFIKKYIKKLAVEQLDYRIHFALNCGAKSCPPIAFYTPQKLEQQLELATISFLGSETLIFKAQKEIHVTRLFQWFLGDFGGIKGIKKILTEKLNIETNQYKIIYKEYSWEEVLDNYVA